MQGGDQSRVHPALKELVAEASRSLARLDAGRLEELALSCQQLNRNLAAADSEGRSRLALQSREAAGEMAVFARVLEASRANLNVMNRLRELHRGRLEYGGADPGWVRTESGYGDD
jgi:aminopeptidase N